MEILTAKIGRLILVSAYHRPNQKRPKRTDILCSTFVRVCFGYAFPMFELLVCLSMRDTTYQTEQIYICGISNTPFIFFVYVVLPGRRRRFMRRCWAVIPIRSSVPFELCGSMRSRCHHDCCVGWVILFAYRNISSTPF